MLEVAWVALCVLELAPDYLLRGLWLGVGFVGLGYLVALKR